MHKLIYNRSSKQTTLLDTPPLSERLKQPSLSPASESAPHCSTIALGLYTSITLRITFFKKKSEETNTHGILYLRCRHWTILRAHVHLRTINKLVTQDWQPWASKAFCDSARDVDWCRFHLHIVFGLRVMKTLTTVYVQIFEAHNFHGLLFPNISQKQFSRIKSFEYTVFQIFASLIFADW